MHTCQDGSNLLIGKQAGHFSHIRGISMQNFGWILMDWTRIIMQGLFIPEADLQYCLHLPYLLQ